MLTNTSLMKFGNKTMNYRWLRRSKIEISFFERQALKITRREDMTFNFHYNLLFLMITLVITPYLIIAPGWHGFIAYSFNKKQCGQQKTTQMGYQVKRTQKKLSDISISYKRQTVFEIHYTNTGTVFDKFNFQFYLLSN